MKYIIHFRHKDGTEDSITITGASTEEIRALTEQEMSKRKIDVNTCWSEVANG